MPTVQFFEITADNLEREKNFISIYLDEQSEIIIIIIIIIQILIVNIYYLKL